MKLSQFDLISTPTGNETVNLNHGKKYDDQQTVFLFVCILVKFDAQLLMMYLYKLLSSLKFEFPSLYPVVGDHSTLLVSFHLKRHMGDFVIQVGIIV